MTHFQMRSRMLYVYILKLFTVQNKDSMRWAFPFVCSDLLLRVPRLIYVCAMPYSYVCVAVCCSVLQCVAVCCSVLQCVAVCCSVLQCAWHRIFKCARIRTVYYDFIVLSFSRRTALYDTFIGLFCQRAIK